jgi:hypothetical protein
MRTTSPRPPEPPTPGYPRRFSWKMRLFLSLFIFCIAYRSVTVLLPISQWCEEYAMAELPRPLPWSARRAELRADAPSGNHFPVLADCGKTAVAIVQFCNPWPSSETRDLIESPLDLVRFVAAWLHSRVLFLERLVAIYEQWGMFAPVVDQTRIHTRARLFYDDGSEIVIRQRAEPADYTHYSHWFEEKILGYEYLVQERDSNSYGYCNMLASRHLHNSDGAQLVAIVLFTVRVELAPPGADAMAHYKEQMRRTATPPRLPGYFRSDASRAASVQVRPDFYAFDVASWQGLPLNDDLP